MTTLDLLFSRDPLSNPADLVFGEGVAPPECQVAIAGSFKALTFVARVAQVEYVGIVGSFSALTFSSAVAYDSKVSRPLVGEARARHQDASQIAIGARGRHNDGDQVRVGSDSHWQVAATIRTGASGRHQDATRVRTRAPSRYQDAARMRTARWGSWQDGDRTRRGAWARHQDALRLKALSTLFRHQDGWRDRRIWTWQRWQEGRRLGVPQTHGWGTAGRLLEYWVGVHQDAMRPPPGRHPTVPVEPPFVCYLPDPDLVFRKIHVANLNLLFSCGFAPPPEAAIIVPVRSVYLVINNVTLVRVAGNVPLDATALSMSIDADSWTWSWSASLPGSALGLIDSEDPVEVQATINGVAYRLFIEQIARERTFARNTLRVSGRGRNAFLGANNDTYGGQPLRTAQQLMNLVLTDNGVSLGWDVEFGIEDWLVPANVWSHQGSRISAIRAIAEAAGGYVQPHRTANTLRILPRYPLAPWDWSASDIELPAAVTQRESIEWVNKPDYNRVFVSGTRDGVLGQVTRGGTAGDVLAPMVTDPLITQATAARQRGLAVLGDTGRQAAVSLRLPVLPETGLILPGKMVRYVDGATTRLGIVRSSALEWSRPELWQSIGVETHA
jgi:hypothetical protein